MKFYGERIYRLPSRCKISLTIGVSWTEIRNFGMINKVCAFNVCLAEDGVSVRRYTGWPAEGRILAERTSRMRSNRFRESDCSSNRSPARHPPWGSYVRGDLSIVSTSNLPGRGPDWCRELFRCLICESDNETELCPKFFSLDLSLFLQPGPVLIVSDHEEYPQSRRMFYFLPLRGFVVDARSTYIEQ